MFAFNCSDEDEAEAEEEDEAFDAEEDDEDVDDEEVTVFVGVDDEPTADVVEFEENSHSFVLTFVLPLPSVVKPDKLFLGGFGVP